MDGRSRVEKYSALKGHRGVNVPSFPVESVLEIYI